VPSGRHRLLFAKIFFHYGSTITGKEIFVKPPHCLIEKATQIKADYSGLTAPGGQQGVIHE
jgi:hypothetical protein